MMTCQVQTPDTVFFLIQNIYFLKQGRRLFFLLYYCRICLKPCGYGNLKILFLMPLIVIMGCFTVICGMKNTA